MERDGEGRPKITMPGSAPPTARQAHERRMYLIGITEKDEVERLWNEKRRALERQKGKRPRRRGG